MVGTLAQAGIGRWSVQDVADALHACDRRACGPVAPAHGLYFTGVDYPPEALISPGEATKSVTPPRHRRQDEDGDQYDEQRGGGAAPWRGAIVVCRRRWSKLLHHRLRDQPPDCDDGDGNDDDVIHEAVDRDIIGDQVEGQDDVEDRCERDQFCGSRGAGIGEHAQEKAAYRPSTVSPLRVL